MDTVKKLFISILASLAIFHNSLGDEFKSKPVTFQAGSALTINSGVTATFQPGSASIFDGSDVSFVGSDVDFTGSSITGFPVAGGDFSTDVVTSVSGEVITFADTTGKLGTRASGSGIATLASGVLGTTANNSGNWNTAYTDRLKWDGGDTDLVAATGRTSLGATTVGSNIFTLTNPSAITFLKMNADNTVGARTPSGMRTDLSLVIGTDVQAFDSQLSSLAGLAYTGNALKVVRVNAGETAFELGTASGGTPGGSDTQVQYNNASAFGGITGATTDGTVLTLTDPVTNAITFSGNQSIPAWTTNGVRIKGVPGTLTDTTSSGTVPTAYTNVLGGNTIAATNATTFTNYYSAYFKVPTAGTNVSLSNRWAIGADTLLVGTSNPLQVTISGVLTATNPGFATSIVTPSSTFSLINTTATTVNAFGAATTLNLGASAAQVLNFGGAASAAEMRFFEPSGSGTNYFGLKAQAMSTTETYLWPPTDGSSGDVLTTDGSGTLSFTTPISGGDSITVDGAAVVNPDFNDGGDINFTDTSNVITADVKTNSVALTTDTTGNYVTSVATSAPLTGGAAASEGATLTLGVTSNGIGPTEIDETANYDWTGVHTFDSDAIRIDDTDASHQLIITPGSDLTANRVFTLTTGDAARTLTMTGDASITGTNTGDQTSIVGITGSLSEFNTALTGADFATGGGTVTGADSGTNTGDQTSIVGITGTKAQFDTAVTDGNFLYAGDITQYTDELAQDATGVMIDGSLTYVDGTPLLQRAALTGAITASAGSNATVLGSFTTAALNTALSDNDVATGGGTATGTNTGDQTSIVGITGSLAEFNTALTGEDFATGGGTATGTNTGDQTSVSGNAGTATALQNARTINGVSFDGTANIVAPAAGTAGNTPKSDGTTWVSTDNGGWDGSVSVQTSDATTTGQTLVDATGLVTTTLLNSTLYEIEVVLGVSTSSGTAGTAYGIHGGGTGSAATMNVIFNATNGATTGVTGTINTIDTATAAVLTAASISGTVRISGFVTTMSTGTATISIQHLKVTSGTSTVKKGSILRWRKAKV